VKAIECPNGQQIPVDDLDAAMRMAHKVLEQGQFFRLSYIVNGKEVGWFQARPLGDSFACPGQVQ